MEIKSESKRIKTDDLSEDISYHVKKTIELSIAVANKIEDENLRLKKYGEVYKIADYHEYYEFIDKDILCKLIENSEEENLDHEIQTFCQIAIEIGLFKGHYYLGKMYNRMKKHTKMVAEFKKGTEKGDVYSMSELGNFYIDNRNDDEHKKGIELLQEAIKKGFDRAYFYLGNYYYNNDDLDAIQFLLPIANKYENAAYIVASIYENMRNYEEAEKYYKIAIGFDFNPYIPVCRGLSYFMYSEYLINQKRNEEANVYMKKSLESGYLFAFKLYFNHNDTIERDLLYLYLKNTDYKHAMINTMYYNIINKITVRLMFLEYFDDNYDKYSHIIVGSLKTDVEKYREKKVKIKCLMNGKKKFAKVEECPICITVKEIIPFDCFHHFYCEDCYHNLTSCPICSFKKHQEMILF